MQEFSSCQRNDPDCLLQYHAARFPGYPEIAEAMVFEGTIPGSRTFNQERSFIYVDTAKQEID
jgi:hypothetical protein